jgi:transposase
MNLFLAELAQAVAPGAHAVVLMDKAGWHSAGDLVIPANLTPVFLPPYSPELNPIERLLHAPKRSSAGRPYGVDWVKKGLTIAPADQH